jgi:hypothetical protein
MQALMIIALVIMAVLVIGTALVTSRLARRDQRLRWLIPFFVLSWFVWLGAHSVDGATKERLLLLTGTWIVALVLCARLKFARLKSGAVIVAIWVLTMGVSFVPFELV